MPLKSYEEDIKQISSEGRNHNNFLVDFAGIALKLEKVGQTAFQFSSFNPCPSLPSVATDSGKQFQCLDIVFNNKSGPLFWNSIDTKFF